jgi:hypothetical protein
MTLRLNGSTSGYTGIDAPAVAGNNTLVLPNGNGSSGQVLATDGTGALNWADNFPAIMEGSIVLGGNTTIVATESIPNTAKRITLLMSSISTNGTSQILVQVGQTGGSYITSGYNSRTTGMGAGSSQASIATNGFAVDVPLFAAANNEISGQITLSKYSTSKWIASGSFHEHSATLAHFWVSGFISGVAGSGNLNKIRLNTAGGTALFDSTASVRAIWEF